MFKELKQVIDIMLSEEPSIVAVYSNWDPQSCSGCIFVQMTGKSLEEMNDFGIRYTDYVKSTYGEGKDFEDFDAAVITIPSSLRFEGVECVYKKEANTLSNDMVTIINKIISENPDVLRIYSDWRTPDCGGEFVVVVPNLDNNRAAEFTVTYTEYVLFNFGSRQDECNSIVILTDNDSEHRTSSVKVYDIDLGGVQSAL